jgi:hypothetical protein
MLVEEVADFLKKATLIHFRDTASFPVNSKPSGCQSACRIITLTKKGEERDVRETSGLFQ